jgi:mono/diheme cytochrome c family protein
LRELLSQTGLYSDTPAGVLAEGVMPYAPQFELWTDGADKRRWVYIPPGEQINTANVDEWKFPVGTKLWKEFSRDGVRVETRLVEKLPPERASEGFEGWLLLAYIWNDEQTDAVASPDGAADAKGTAHDVPSQEACGKCHDMRTEKPLGFSAVQLAHDGEGATLTTLQAAGLFNTPITADLTVPGDETQRALLGYFHANCGHCHRERAPTNSRVSTLRLWLESDALASFEESDMYQALVNHATESGQGSIYESRVVGGDPDSSELMRRVSLRATSPEIIEMNGESGDVPMPPLGTEVVDDAAVQAVRDWILALPPPAAPAAP